MRLGGQRFGWDHVVSRVGVMKLNTVVEGPVKDTHLISYRRQTASYRKSMTTHGMLYFCSLKQEHSWTHSKSVGNKFQLI